MVIHTQLAKMRPSSVKIWKTQVPWDRSAHLSSFWELTKTKYRQNISTHLYSAQEELSNDSSNPTLVSDLSNKNIKCTSNFWTDFGIYGMMLYFLHHLRNDMILFYASSFCINHFASTVRLTSSVTIYFLCFMLYGPFEVKTQYQLKMCL